MQKLHYAKPILEDLSSMVILGAQCYVTGSSASASCADGGDPESSCAGNGNVAGAPCGSGGTPLAVACFSTGNSPA